MKSMFEYMTTVLVMMIVSFVFVSFIAIELGATYARLYHSKVVEDIQNKGNYSEFDPENYDDNLEFVINDDNTIKVIYHYDINTPILGKIKGKDIVGYAR